MVTVSVEYSYVPSRLTPLLNRRFGVSIMPANMALLTRSKLSLRVGWLCVFGAMVGSCLMKLL